MEQYEGSILSRQEQEEILISLYRRYNGAMLHRALGVTRRLPDAEDAVSSCWLSLMGHLPELDRLSEPMQRAYVMKAVQNAAIDALRRRSRESPCDVLTPQDESPRPDQLLEARDTVAFLLGVLPPRQQFVARMHLDGYPTRDIAAQLGVSPASVRAHWFRALRRLRRLCEALRDAGSEN